jgi:hypothetical protein
MSEFYLRSVLQRWSPPPANVFAVTHAVEELQRHICESYAPGYVKRCCPSGSWAKGTAIARSSDADIFISLSSTTSMPLRDVYEELVTWADACALEPQRQNVSVRVTWRGWSIDLVPGRRQQQYGNDHSLFVRRSHSWTQTNIDIHIRLVIDSGRSDEIRLAKVWRELHHVDLPSFLLELAVLDALHYARHRDLTSNMLRVLEYFATNLPTVRLVDPANTANVVSAELSGAEKSAIANLALRDYELAHAGRWDRVLL